MDLLLGIQTIKLVFCIPVLKVICETLLNELLLNVLTADEVEGIFKLLPQKYLNIGVIILFEEVIQP